MQERKMTKPEAMLVKAKENARVRELNIKLLEACKLENMVRVGELIRKGANLHLLNKDALHAYNDNERNPVHIAAQVNSLDILKLLIESGADCSAQDRRDITPLHLAVYNAYQPMIDYLVSECKADIEIKDVDGGTPLSWAAYENKLEVAKQLLALGAKVDEPDFEKRTSLHWAAYRGHRDMVAFLVEQGGDISLKTTDHETPLDIAVNNGRTEVVELLCELQSKD